MANDTPPISQGVVPHFLSKDDFLSFAETADFFDNMLDDIRDVIDCRADIFMQKKEKHQQILDHRMMKLENEKNEYLKKSEIVMNEMGRCKSYLMQIEHSYFNLKNKLSIEKQANKILKDKINHLQLDSKKKDAKFYKTAELYSTVINWYKDYLSLCINLDKENYNIITISFKENTKGFEDDPFVKLEALEGNKFKILKMHPLVEENNDLPEIVQGHEVILFLHKFRNLFLATH